MVGSGSGMVRLGDGTLLPMLGQGPSTGSPPPVGHGSPGGVIGPVVGRSRDGAGSGLSGGLAGLSGGVVGPAVGHLSDGSGVS